MIAAGARIFISYKRGHAASVELVDRFERALLDAGYRVLVDRGMEVGKRWRAELYTWLDRCEGAIVIASDESTTSEWCQREWECLALREHVGISVVPVLLALPASKLRALTDLQAIEASAPDLEARVLAVLSQSAPVSEVSPDEFVWRHREWLSSQYRFAPVLDHEPFSLADAYIDTECGYLPWKDIDPREPHCEDPFDESAGPRVRLLDKVLELMGDPKFRDIIIVQGPAGSGKSSFTLRLAEELSAKGLEPLLVRFRDMRLAHLGSESVDVLLQDALRLGPDGESAVRANAPILDERRLRATSPFGNATICRTVVILDGWDEVSLAGSASYRSQLRTWLPKIREFLVSRTGAPVRLVVTGRPSLEVKDSGFLRGDTAVLTLRPIQPSQLSEFSRKICEAWDAGFELSDEVLRRYQTWYRDRQQVGVEMLGQPLLALLAVRTLVREGGGVGALLDTPTALYKRLIDHTVTEAARSEETVRQGGAALRRLLQRVAAVCSVFRSERISFEEASRRLKDEKALQEWVTDATRDAPFHALVVNFWFKGGNAGLGCEFLHKSFREFLFAEALLAKVNELFLAANEQLTPSNRRYWEDFAEGTIHHDASRALAQLLSPQWLTAEIRSHVLHLLRTFVAERPSRLGLLRVLFSDVYAWWAEGAHLRPHPKGHTRPIQWQPVYVNELATWTMPLADGEAADPVRVATLDAHLGDALMQITAFIFGELTTEGGNEPQPPTSNRHCRVVGERVCFLPGGGGFFDAIVSRLGVALFRPLGRDIAGAILPGVYLREERLPLNMANVSLRKADLNGATLDGVNLSEADLTGCSMEGAYAERTNLTRGKLDGASLARTNFSGSNLARATFVGAKLKGANFTNVELRGVNLSNADMRDVLIEGNTSFYEAKASGADFRAAWVTDESSRPPASAAEEYASLRDVDFRKADLCGADFRGADLENADLGDANLQGADLRWARLAGANLRGANLAGAKVARWRLEEIVDPIPDGVEFADDLDPMGS